jgi:hypothetical protein
MKLRRTTLVLLLAALSGLARGATIDFEDLAVDKVIGRKYVRFGVVFSTSVFIQRFDGHRTAPAPHSGYQVAYKFQPEFGAGPMTLTFLSAQQRVSFFGCSYDQNVQGIAKAFDSNGSVIAQDGPKPLAGGACADQFQLTVAGPSIMSVEFLVFDNQSRVGSLGIDDLTIEGDPPPAVPTGVPAVSIDSMAEGELFDSPHANLAGSVTGEGLPQTVQVQVEPLRRPGDLSPGKLSTVPLTGTGIKRGFAASIDLEVGKQTITVTAENSGGIDGSASVSVFNLPQLIRDATGALGALQWAVGNPTCKVAIYAAGGLATDGSTSFHINPDLIPKYSAWIKARAAYGASTDQFCPTENPRPVFGQIIAQNFRGGRMYSDPVRGVIFVPGVFAGAIDTLGGEGVTGAPLADPTRSWTAGTWLFQQFLRAEGGLPSTLEIKGSPPELWVHRQGGDLVILKNAGLSLGPSTATITEHFPCNANEGPCAVTHSSSAPPSVSDAKNQFCKGTTFSLLPPPAGPDEWVPITGSQTQAIPVLGWVAESRPSDCDDIASHEFPYTSSCPGSVWADWDLFVHPIDPYRNILAGNSRLEIEFEYFTAQDFFVIHGGQPLVGDLYFAAGRWIIDCGHDDYSSEIHPPFLTASIRTEGGLATPITKASIWVNGYYRGDAPLEVLLFPPPRPAPNAFMVVSRTLTQDAAVGLDVISTSDPEFADPQFSSFVRARFSAAQRPANLGWAGILHFMGGREYEGDWTIGWQTEPAFSIAGLSSWWWP